MRPSSPPGPRPARRGDAARPPGPHWSAPPSARPWSRPSDGLRTRSVVRDLTPEREWEEALRQSRQRFQRFFADAPVGIALLDRDGRFEEANRALGELFGVPPADLIGRKLVRVPLRDRRPATSTRRLAVAAESAANPRPIERPPQGLARALRHRVLQPARTRRRRTRPASSCTSSTRPSRRTWRPSSPSRRRCRRWASSPAASRTTSTIC